MIQKACEVGVSELILKRLSVWDPQPETGRSEESACLAASDMQATARGKPPGKVQCG